MEIFLTEWKPTLISEAKGIGFYLNTNQIDLLSIFVFELLTFNSRFNITAIKHPNELIVKHILDSFIPSRFIHENSSVLDIGTGGGFPGIPLKIIMPSLSMTLIDGSRKKINFLKYVIRKLNLENINARQVRAESLTGNPNTGQKFDVVISRAVTSLEKFILLALPLIKDNGTIISMKGEHASTESELMGLNNYFKSLTDLPPKIQIKPYRLPGLSADRHLVIVGKTS